MAAECCNGDRPHAHALSVSKKTELKFKARSLLIDFLKIATEKPVAPPDVEFKEYHPLLAIHVEDNCVCCCEPRVCDQAEA